MAEEDRVRRGTECKCLQNVYKKWEYFIKIVKLLMKYKFCFLLQLHIKILIPQFSRNFSWTVLYTNFGLCNLQSYLTRALLSKGVVTCRALLYTLHGDLTLHMTWVSWGVSFTWLWLAWDTTGCLLLSRVDGSATALPIKFPVFCSFSWAGVGIHQTKE